MATASFGQWADPQEQAIERQRALAQALQQDSLSPIPNQEAGGRTVKNSPVQYLAKLAQALVAKQGMQKADTDAVALRDQQQATSAKELQGIIGALKGTAGTPATAGMPATPEVQGNNPSAYVPAQAAQPGIPAVPPTAGDPDKALQMALVAKSPMAQQMAQTLMTAALPKPAKWTAFEKPNADGSVQKGVINLAAADPVSTFQAAGTAPVKGEANNGILQNQYTGATIGNAIPKQPDAPSQAKDLLIPDPNNPGQMVPNTALIQARQQIAKAGASSNNISVTADKSYGSNLAEGLAKQDVATLDAARNAPQQIATSQRIRKLLDTTTPITGTGANARLAINKAFATAGLVDPKDANATEALVSDLNKQTLANVKSSGLGAAQGFTDKDLVFVQAANSGNIEMTPQNIRRMADLNEKSARETMKRGQGIMTYIKANPNKFGGVGGTVDLTPPPEYQSPGQVNNVRAQADKILGGQ